MSSKTFIFYGASGSGKGTQAKLLKKYLEEKDSGCRVLHISTGDVLREAIKENTNYTLERASKVMEDGGLLKEFVPIWAWSNFLMKNFSGEEHLIFDGVGRKKLEVSVLDGALRFYDIENPFIVYLKVSDEEATKRLLSRARVDDTEEDIKERLEWFHKEVQPLFEYYEENKGYFNFLEVDGEGSVEEIHKNIISKIK